MAILLVLVFGLLVSLAVLAPITYPPPADPYSTVPGVGPPWYLLAPFGFLELTAGVVPQWGAGLVLFIAYVVFLAVPFLIRRQPTPESERSGADPWVLGIAIAVVAAWIALTLYGARAI